MVSRTRIGESCGGMVETEGSRSMGVIGSEAEKMMVTQTPLGHIGRPDDIAFIAVFLTSNDSA